MRRTRRLTTSIVGAAVIGSGLSSVAAAEEVGTPTFAKDVAPILYERCVSCHLDGEVAPMSLITYGEARPWARAIKSEVVSREMPPWHVDSSAGLTLRNDRSLDQAEIDTIVAWVDAGAPNGDDADLPPAPTFAQGWGHPSGRSPDAVIQMPISYEIPADGMVPYVNFFSKVPFEKDVFAEAIEARPGNRRAVHHMTASVMPMPEPPPPVAMPLPVDSLSTPRSAEEQEQFLQSAEGTSVVLASGVTALFTPGQGFEQFPVGFGKRVRGGPDAYMNFNMHYQLTGRPESDRSSVGIWLHRDPVQHEMVRSTGTEGTFLAEGKELLFVAGARPAPLVYAAVPNIPPHAANYKTVVVTPFTEPTTIYQFNPHAHLRGKDFNYSLVYPDGREQVLLSVPRYDFNWQVFYVLEEPLSVPAGSKLVVIGHFDNSAANRYNPAPNREVA